MDEDATEDAEMKDLTSTSFAYIIAFLLPGLLAMYALNFWPADVARLPDPAFKAQATVGPSLILILMALGMGLCVSALRFFIFEKFLCRRHSFPPDMFAKLTKSNRLTSFRAVVDEHYRYHQFYGGCAVGFAVLYGGWLRNTWVLSWHVVLISLAFVVLEVVLFKTAINAFERYVARGDVVVNG